MVPAIQRRFTAAALSWKFHSDHGHMPLLPAAAILLTQTRFISSVTNESKLVSFRMLGIPPSDA